MKILMFFLFFLLISCSSAKKLEVSISKNGNSTNKDLIIEPSTDGMTEEDQFQPLNRQLQVTSTDEDREPKAAMSKRPEKYPENEPSNGTLPKGEEERLKANKFEKVESKEIKIGNLIYHVPDTMIERKTYIIRIRLNRDSSDNTLKTGISEKIVESVIKTTSRMEVEIIDPSPQDKKNFEIVKSNEDIQLVDNVGFTEWVFGVTPLKSGNFKLNIVISIIKGDDKKQVVYFDDVYVKANPKANLIDFVVKYWQWFMSTIIIPFIVWFYNKKKKKG